MASSSRLFLLLALVAILLLTGVTAQNDTPANGGKKKKGGGKCPKGAPWNTCSKCTGTGNDKICVKCKDKNAEVNDEEDGCVCKEGFGTITKEQYKEFCLNSDSAAHGGDKGKGKGKDKHKGKTPKGCFDCESCPGLVADENGVCIGQISGNEARRLFAVDEDIWV